MNRRLFVFAIKASLGLLIAFALRHVYLVRNLGAFELSMGILHLGAVVVVAFAWWTIQND